jgi:regulator of replication initiation timing
LGQIPQKFQEVLSQREAWERQIWQQYAEMRSEYSELYQQLQQTSRQNDDLQQQVASLQQENARLSGQLQAQHQSQQQLNRNLAQPTQLLEQQQASPASEEVPLRSEVGYDYTHLRDLLAEGKWKDADEQTTKAMLQVAGRTDRSWLDKDDIDQFPCEDLRTIDRLWVKYSNGRFGFSVQKEIYQSLGGTREYNREIWRKFGDAVGWRQNGKWLSYVPLWFTPYREGHLPLPVWRFKWLVVSWLRLWSWLYEVRPRDYPASLYSRSDL